MKKLGILFGLLVLGFSSSKAQIDHTLYNMSHLPQIQLVNPSFQPTTKWYVSLSPYVKAVNTGFVLDDVIGNRKGDTLLFDAGKFLKKLNRRNHIQASAIADFGIGVRINPKLYLQFGLAEKVSSTVSVPKDLFEFAILGNAHPDLIGTELNIGGFDINAIHYREMAFGASYQMNCGLGFGARIKRLTGFENIHSKDTKLSVKTDPTTYDLLMKSNMDIRMSGIDSATDSRYEESSYLFNGPNNKGWGIDLGANYKYKKFTLTASLLDLGFITWKENTMNVKSRNPNSEFVFSGVDVNKLSDSTDIDEFLQELLDTIGSQFGLDTTRGNKYRTSLNTRLYIGGQFQWKSFTVGGTFFSEFYNGGIRPGIAAMIRKDFGRFGQVQLNYSAMNRNLVNIGLGISGNLGPVQLFMVSDNVIGTLLRPTKTKNVQFRFGANFGWWYGRDCKNPCTLYPEKCAERAEKARIKALKNLDTDGDGIQDFWDSCVFVPGVKALNGCPDADGDMITDSLDRCPNEAGVKYLDGCPDNDKDSIENALDDCPDVFGPKELNGCPDADGDGVFDFNDSCVNVKGPAENNGCPWGDKDGDNLTDNIDDCPDEKGPEENKGCPWGDKDGDGVTDNIDKCIDIKGPAANKGCPYTDTDKDGVLDKDDDCPNTPGIKKNRGCPVIEKEEQEVLNVAFENLEFQTGKSIIQAGSYESLNNLAELLKKKTEYKLSIEGHTDNVGDVSKNLQLSKDRANSVMQYLLGQGVGGAQISSNWFGSSKPIADNATAEGRQKNRRVEMNVVFD